MQFESINDFNVSNITEIHALSAALKFAGTAFPDIPGLNDTFTKTAANLTILANSNSPTHIIDSVQGLVPVFRDIEEAVAQCTVDSNNIEQLCNLQTLLGELKTIIPYVQNNLPIFMPGSISTLLNAILKFEFLKSKTERAFSSALSCVAGIANFIEWKINVYHSPHNINLSELIASTKKALSIADPMPDNQTLMPLAFLSRTLFNAMKLIYINKWHLTSPALIEQINTALTEAQKTLEKIKSRHIQIKAEHDNVPFYNPFGKPILLNQISFCIKFETEFNRSRDELSALKMGESLEAIAQKLHSATSIEDKQALLEALSHASLPLPVEQQLSLLEFGTLTATQPSQFSDMLHHKTHAQALALLCLWHLGHNPWLLNIWDPQALFIISEIRDKIVTECETQLQTVPENEIATYQHIITAKDTLKHLPYPYPHDFEAFSQALNSRSHTKSQGMQQKLLTFSRAASEPMLAISNTIRKRSAAI